MTNAFRVSGLTKTYQDFVLDHVSFTVPSGFIVGLIGENGAGKSTAINAALGLIQKEHGNQKTCTSIYYSITLFLYANIERNCLHQNRYQMI